MAKIVIAGGGTGGHVYPALAIGQSLVDEGVSKSDIVYIGSKHSIEKQVIPANGFKLKVLPGRGLNRSEWLKNIWHAILIIFSCLKVLVSFLFFRPKVIVGVGGYASMPAIAAGSILRIPMFVHEQNAVVTRSNKIAIKFGATLLTSRPDTKGQGKNYEYVGLPLRKTIGEAIEVREKYLNEPKEKPQVLVMGGSLGSLVINNTTIEMVEKYKDEIDFDIVHIAGKSDFQRVSTIYDKLEVLIDCREFDENLIEVVAKSDIVVSRAGAATCAELETLGVKSILIPLPSAPGDHQTLNAQSLCDLGLGIVIKQNTLSSDLLFETIKNNLDDNKCKPNEFHLDAAKRISQIIKTIMEEKHESN